MVARHVIGEALDGGQLWTILACGHTLPGSVPMASATELVDKLNCKRCGLRSPVSAEDVHRARMAWRQRTLWLPEDASKG